MITLKIQKTQNNRYVLLYNDKKMMD